jgi:tetratricopeptide (TPR) repeat protein
MKEHKALDAMLEQGFAQLKEERFEEAVETFSACHAIEDNDDRPLRGRGLALIQLKNAPFAEIDFRLARQINGDEPENWTGLALSLAMQNKIYEAFKIYEDLLEVKPNFVPGYMQLARLHFKLGAINKGRDVLNTALTHRPEPEQRRAIEAALKEQAVLDKGRYYRPDFERLSKESDAFGFLRGFLSRFKKKDEVIHGHE